MLASGHRHRGGATIGRTCTATDVGPAAPDTWRRIAVTPVIGSQSRQLCQSKQALNLPELLDLILARRNDRRSGQAGSRGGATARVGSGVAESVSLRMPAQAVFLR
jgi:hypothetical protein